MSDAPGPELLAASLLMLGLVAVATANVRGIWSGDKLDRLRLNLSWWPYSSDAREAWIRALPVGLTAGYLVVAATIAAALIRLGAAGSARAWLSIILSVGLVGAFVAVGIMSAIIAFNIPKSLVPPPLRGQEGLLSAWRRRRRARSAKRGGAR